MDEFTTNDVEKWIKAWPVEYAERAEVETSRVWAAMAVFAIAFLVVGSCWVGYQLIEFVSMVTMMQAYR